MSDFSGILSQIAEKDDAYQRRAFTPESVMATANQAAKEFQRANMNLLSCYELEGEFGLHQTLGHFCKTNNPAGAEIEAALGAGNEQELFLAFLYAMRSAFVRLYEKGALRRLQLVGDSELPPEAVTEYQRMRAVVFPPPPAPPVPKAPTLTADEYNRMEASVVRRRYTNDPVFKQQVDALAANGGIHVTEPIVEGRVTARRQTPPASVSTETPEETCAREFKEMPSTAWKQKWLLNQNNRAVADRCALEGKL